MSAFLTQDEPANTRPHPSQGAEWVNQICNGDQAAFEALFRAFAPGLCAFITRYVGSRATAEDLVQDIFVTLWKKRAELRIETSVSSYLYRAAKYRALNQLRNEKTGARFRTALLEVSPSFSGPGENEILELLDVQEAIQELPARCRLIFTLNRQHGMTYREIATSLGLSIKTVETQMGRALKALRLRLASLRA